MAIKWYISMTSSYRHSDVTLTLVLTWVTLQTLQNVMNVEAGRYLNNDVTRFKGEEFKSEIDIAGRHVTCEKRQNNKPQKPVYPAELWSCRDIRVGGRRLQYWHMDGLCSDGRNASRMVANDYGALCRQILQLHGIRKNLWSAMISEASCKHSLIPRVIYMKNRNATYSWDDYQAGRGYVITLQCMVDPPPSSRPWR